MYVNVKMRFINGVSKALTLSYDDGAAVDERLIDIMQKNGLKGTFNLNSSMFACVPGSDEEKRVNRLKQLYIESGNEIACHGVYHPMLEKLTLPQMLHEILDDRENLEKEFGRIVRGMAYPYGTYNNDVLQALKLCGICYSRTVGTTGGFEIPQNWLELKATCHHDDARLWEITDRFINSSGCKEPMLFYMWGHSHEFQRNNNWNRFEEFAEKVGKRNDTWYATNIEIYDYVQGFNRLHISADCSIIHNPNSFTVWLAVDNKELAVAPGETKRI